MHSGQCDPMFRSAEAEREPGEEARGAEEGEKKKSRRRQQTARSLCGRAAWPLALSPHPPLLLQLLLLSDDDRMEKNREKKRNLGYGGQSYYLLDGKNIFFKWKCCHFAHSYVHTGYASRCSNQ